MKPKRGRPRKSTASMETEIILADLVPDDTTCKFCHAEFLDEGDLLVHIEQLHGSENTGFVSCGFCTLRMKSLDEYALHIRDRHFRDFKCCKFCFRIFTDVKKLTVHQKKHIISPKKAEFACSVCQKLFKDTYSLELHEYKEHRDNGDGIILKECLPHLSAVLNATASTLIQNVATDITYTCHSCRFTTLDSECYILHLQKEDCQCYVCDKCCIVNKHKESIQNHMLKHKECHNYVREDDVKKICSECNQLIDIPNWKTHVNSCKVIKCTICHIIFNSLQDLAVHQNTEHPLTVTVEKCKYCHREFIGTVTLNKHMNKSHKNNLHLYKYHCLICSTHFQHPKKLFGHYYSTHKDLEPYTCTICNQKFRIRKRFTLHIKLEHKSVGYVEFDENYHVFFSNKKSEHPFVPQPLESDANAAAKLIPIDTNSSGTNKPTSEWNKDHSYHKYDGTIHLDLKADLMNPTETELEQTEIEEAPVQETRLKRKCKIKPQKIVPEDDSEDEPLMKLKKLVKTKRYKPSNGKAKGIKQFTCKLCQKYCYTYQNYVHHMNLHDRNEVKCIKCQKVFTSRIKLNKHMKNDHSKSRLTDTLKKILERKKSSNLGAKTCETEKGNFCIKMKKVENCKSDVSAKLTQLPDNSISLQNFIENFTPDSGVIAKNQKDKPIVIESIVSLSVVNSNEVREPKIKMTKFIPKPPPLAKPKLAMPIKFKPCIEQNRACIKIVQQPVANSKFKIHMQSTNLVSQDEIWTDMDHYEEVVNEERDTEIPEISQEFTVIESADESKPIITDHKVIIPKLPKVLDDVRIGHLLPEAPYYKIVRVKDVLKAQAKEVECKEKVILPGKKLVTANPLAHLLKDKDIKAVCKENKYYKSKPVNFEAAIAKALIKLDTPDGKKRDRKTKSKTDDTKNQEIE